MSFSAEIEGRGATTNPAAKWPNCRVPYTIANRFGQQGVNFNNILRAAFLFESVLCSISLITIWL
jgi:hypothetical protein